ncbi:hypothetical protein [Shewanella sp.]|uniref:hypothetical protein n=1 Tax=Shewanella sp. TaxID=50422 RepID=UPI003D1140DE
MKDIPLLITTCILPSAPYTKLNNIQERLHHTITGLRELSKIASNNNVVICDGSGFDFSDYQAEIESLFCKSEIISFKNNYEMVKIKGKGYGEGEIVKYAISHSKLINQAQKFAKITGKLWVENLNSLISIQKTDAAFLPTLSKYDLPICIDTRFYICSLSFYKKFLIDVHELVDDRQGNHLEDIFFKKLKSINIEVSDVIFRKYPVIRGCSGTTANIYKQKKYEIFKKMLKLYLYIFVNRGKTF